MHACVYTNRYACPWKFHKRVYLSSSTQQVEPCFHPNTSLLAYSGDVLPARADKSIGQRIIAVLKVGDVPEFKIVQRFHAALSS